MHRLKITPCSTLANEADDEGVPEDFKTRSLLKHLALIAPCEEILVIYREGKLRLDPSKETSDVYPGGPQKCNARYDETWRRLSIFKT